MAAFRACVSCIVFAAFRADLVEDDTSMEEALSLLQVRASAMPRLGVSDNNTNEQAYACWAASVGSCCGKPSGTCRFSADPHMSTNFGGTCSEFHSQGPRWIGRSVDVGVTWDIQVYSCHNGGGLAGYGAHGVAGGAWTTIIAFGVRYKGTTVVTTRYGDLWINGERKPLGRYDLPSGVMVGQAGAGACVDVGGDACQSIYLDGGVGVVYVGAREYTLLQDRMAGCTYPNSGNAVPDHVPFAKIMFTREQTELLCNKCGFFREYCRHPPDIKEPLDPRNICEEDSHTPFAEAEAHCVSMKETHHYDDCLMDYCTLSGDDFEESETNLNEFEHELEEETGDQPTTTWPPEHMWPPEYWLPNCDTVSEPDRFPFPLVAGHCSAFAPYWTGGTNCDTSGEVLHFDQWSENGGQPGYFQVQFDRPIQMDRFEMECDRAPAFGIRYSNDGRVWRTAALTRTNKVNPRVDWENVGAFKFWRFEIRNVPGAWQPGPWYKNLHFYEDLGPYCQTILPPHCSIVRGQFYVGEAKCESTADAEAGMTKVGNMMTKCMSGKAGVAERLVYNSWKHVNIGIWFYKIELEEPKEFVGFSSECVNFFPNFVIHYSPDGELWNTAYRSDSMGKGSGQNPYASWIKRGAWKFWRMMLDGRDFTGGGGNCFNYRWYTEPFCQDTVPPICDQANIRTYLPDDMECNAHAKHWMPVEKEDQPGEWCFVEPGQLRFHPWTNFGGQAAWYETHFEDRVMILGLDYQTEQTAGQLMNAYQILFSQDATEYGIAYEELEPKKDRAAADVIHLRWQSVGKKHFWRYQYNPAGQVSNNPNAWFANFQWKRAEECLWTTTPTTTTTAPEWATAPPSTTEERGDVVINPNLPLDAADSCVRAHMEGYYCTAMAAGWAPVDEKTKGMCDTDQNNIHFSGWQTRTRGQEGVGGTAKQTCKQEKCEAYYQVDTWQPTDMCSFSIRCPNTPNYWIKYSDGGAPGSDPDSWDWQIACDKSSNEGAQQSIGCHWEESKGAHRYWRYVPYTNSGNWHYDMWFWQRQSYGSSAAPTELCENDDYNLNLKDVVSSNLGGLGPDYGAEENIRYNGVLRRGEQDIDMLIVANGPYTGKGEVNGVTGEGEGSMGVVNVWTGTEVDLSFKFVKSGTNEPMEVDNFLFSILDLDLGKKGKGRESMTFDATANGCARSYRTNPSEIEVVGNQFTATTHGTGNDNPTNLKEMTDQQQQRSVAFRCGGVSEMRATFKIEPGQGARNFHFAGASSVACPPERSTLVTTTTPGPACPKPLPSEGSPNKVLSCGVWRDPHVTQNFYGGPAFDQFHEGIVDIIKSLDGKIHIQAFMCDSGAGTTSINGIAVKNDGDYVSWMRGLNTVGNCDFPCVKHPIPPVEEMWILSVNGHKQDWAAMPRAWPGGTWMLQTNDIQGAPDNRDGQQICMGDYERRMTFKVGLDKVREEQGKSRFFPSIHLEMQEEYVGAVGLCGTSSGRRDVGYDDAIFTVTEVSQLCDICGLSKGTLTEGGCTPPASFHGGRSPEEVCRQAGVPFSEAEEKCSSLNLEGENQQAFFHACIEEYCASGGDPIEVELASEEEHFEEFHEKTHPPGEDDDVMGIVTDDTAHANGINNVQHVPNPCGGGTVPAGFLDGTFKYRYEGFGVKPMHECQTLCMTKGGNIARMLTKEAQIAIRAASHHNGGNHIWAGFDDVKEENLWRSTAEPNSDPFCKTRQNDGKNEGDIKIVNGEVCYKPWCNSHPQGVRANQYAFMHAGAQETPESCWQANTPQHGWDCICEFEY